MRWVRHLTSSRQEWVKVIENYERSQSGFDLCSLVGSPRRPNCKGAGQSVGLPAVPGQIPTKLHKLDPTELR